MIPTFMGAHAFPNEYEKNHEGYVNLICDEMIPKVAKQGLLFSLMFSAKKATSMLNNHAEYLMLVKNMV